MEPTHQITYPSAFALPKDAAPLLQEEGSLLTSTILTFHLPHGAVRISHKGTYLILEREWDPTTPIWP